MLLHIPDSNFLTAILPFNSFFLFVRHSFRFLKKKDSSITSHIFVGLLLHANPLHVVRTLPKMDPSMHPIGRSSEGIDTAHCRSVDVVELFLFYFAQPVQGDKEVVRKVL